MNPPLVSIVVPFYNEEETIGPLFERLRPLAARGPARWEFVLVNDGSRDGTRQRLLEELRTVERWKLLQLSRTLASKPRIAPASPQLGAMRLSFSMPISNTHPHSSPRCSRNGRRARSSLPPAAGVGPNAACAGLASIVKFPFWGRHFAPVFPFVWGLEILGLRALLAWLPRRLAVAAGLGFAGLLAGSSLLLRAAPRHGKDDYRSAVRIDRKQVRPESLSGGQQIPRPPFTTRFALAEAKILRKVQPW